MLYRVNMSLHYSECKYNPLWIHPSILNVEMNDSATPIVSID